MNEPVDLVKRIEANKPEEKYAFECPCGNQQFILRPDAKIECAHCHVIQVSLIWGQFFQSNHVEPPKHTG